MKKFRDTDYYITEDGEVYSKKWSTRNRNDALIKMKPHIDANGYYRIGICIDEKQKYFKVHRLVAEVYIPNPDNLPIVEHRDDIKTNNHVSNLMWSTVADNNRNAIKNGLKNIPNGEKHHKSKLTEEQVKWIRQNYISRHPEFGCAALGRKFNVSSSLIGYIIHNKTWKHLSPQSNSITQ